MVIALGLFAQRGAVTLLLLGEELLEHLGKGRLPPNRSAGGGGVGPGGEFAEDLLRFGAGLLDGHLGEGAEFYPGH
ncbi:hypothetical protein D9M68_956420 [compost metagenome]